MHFIGGFFKWLAISVGVLVGIIILIVVVAIGTAGSDSDKSSAQVTKADYRQIHHGMTKADVLALVGKPESKTSTSVSGLTMDCWDYGVLSTNGTYQFCFSNGKLDSKLTIA